ncbi:MAG: VIT1/CCC1 transporter family protein [Halobacteria archaeon]|nr:VIT1/CCC1 transporter family protein [Halobacteria archaeon]
MWGIGFVRDTLQDEEARSISRRYFISNGFDGALTSVGITVGSYLSGVPDGLTVVKVGVGAAVGLSTSGVWSVWEIERAEKLAELQRLERSMMKDLKGTSIYTEKKRVRIVNSVMSGLGPVVGILLPVLVFAFEGIYLTMLEATLISVAVAVSVLFVFGAYMGSISKQRWYVAGLRMGVAGVVVAGINVLLPG